MESHNKETVYEVPLSNSPSNAGFDRGNFIDAIDGKGYKCYVERAFQCGCRNRSTGSPSPTCRNCGGSGWIFVNKRETRVVIQQMNRSTKFKSWTKEDAGNVSCSFLPGEDISFMDRITNLDLLSSYSENIQIFSIDGNQSFVGKTVYYPLEIVGAYLFAGENVPLIPLQHNTDFTIQDNLFKLSDNSLLDGLYNTAGSTLGARTSYGVSLRYLHSPSFHIIDITRERVKTKSKDCSDGLFTLKDMVTHAIAQRTHYIIDSPDISGTGLFDNSYVQNNKNF